MSKQILVFKSSSLTFNLVNKFLYSKTSSSLEIKVPILLFAHLNAIIPPWLETFNSLILVCLSPTYTISLAIFSSMFLVIAFSFCEGLYMLISPVLGLSICILFIVIFFIVFVFLYFLFLFIYY